MEKTIKIRMTTSVAGTDYAYRANQVVDAPEHIAKDLLKGGHAVPENDSRAENPELKIAKRIEKR